MRGNSMRRISVEKIVLNIGCGTTRKIEDASAILAALASRKPVITHNRKRSTFNVPKGKPIGCKITIRDDAEGFIKRLLEAKENTLKEASFDSTGNVSFGVKEYIDVPEMEYDPKIGIIGFDVCVTLTRPGYRVKKKKRCSQIGKNHRIRKEEAIEFMKERFNVSII